MPAANLGTFDNQRTAFAQLGVRFEQKLFLFVKLEIQDIAGRAFTLCVDMQSEKFAGRKPIFLSSLEFLFRLADYLKLVVTEEFFQLPLDPREFRRNYLWLRNVFRNNESTPHRLRSLSL